MRRGCRSTRVRRSRRPGARRIYSNYGFEVAAALVAERAEMAFAEYFAHVWSGTGMRLTARPAPGSSGTIGGSAELARELQAPQRIAPETLAEAATVQFPGLDGVLPGFGRQKPNDWGLGLELRDSSRRTGRVRATRRARSVTSGGAARFSGSIRRPGSRSVCSPTGGSATGRRRVAAPWPTRFSPPSRRGNRAAARSAQPACRLRRDGPHPERRPIRHRRSARRDGARSR